MIRVADYVIQFLEDYGVEDIFTVSGGGSIFLCDAVARAKKLKYYCCHHEQAVSFASESYARTKNSLGVSLVTTGPGATNAISGACGSWMDSVPHLLISGQVLSLIHISEPTRRTPISYAVFCLKKCVADVVGRV